MSNKIAYPVNSISEQHKILALPKAQHPLISVFNFDEIDYSNFDHSISPLLLNLYCISLKRNVQEKITYGQGYYDFDEGIMSFIGPHQITCNIERNQNPVGICVVFHPDLLYKHPLQQKIKQYGFFDYAVNEALHLSEKEEQKIVDIMMCIKEEITSSIDSYSENVIISQLELLLNYSDRYYNRQFLTRKKVSHDLLSKLELLLEDYFSTHKTLENGLPTVNYTAEQLGVSTHYLNDLLKHLTGITTQQHIHIKVIEQAKHLLSTTTMSVSETAYLLGFNYPQSFNKLFKNQTQKTPLEFRALFN